MPFCRSYTTLVERMIQGLAALVLQSSTGTLSTGHRAMQANCSCYAQKKRQKDDCSTCMSLSAHAPWKIAGYQLYPPRCMFIGLVSLQAKGSECAEPGHV